jgi:hypothetical protein
MHGVQLNTDLQLPKSSSWIWEFVQEKGGAVSVILSVAKNTQSESILMTTDGPHGFLDGLRGTATGVSNDLGSNAKATCAWMQNTGPLQSEYCVPL